MDKYVPTSANLRYPCLVFRVVCNNSDALFQENDFFQQREKRKGNNILSKLATSYTTTVNNEEKRPDLFPINFCFLLEAT